MVRSVRTGPTQAPPRPALPRRAVSPHRLGRPCSLAMSSQRPGLPKASGDAMELISVTTCQYSAEILHKPLGNGNVQWACF